MEYDMRSETAIFWREIYLTALGSGHPDPAAAADEAFLAFDCRFGESMEAVADFEASVAEQVEAINQEVEKNAGLEFVPHHGYATANEHFSQPWGRGGPLVLTASAEHQMEVDRLTVGALRAGHPAFTADELFLQANKFETVTPSVVVSDPPVQNPSTEGLSAVEWKSDDEVLG